MNTWKDKQKFSELYPKDMKVTETVVIFDKEKFKDEIFRIGVCSRRTGKSNKWMCMMSWLILQYRQLVKMIGGWGRIKVYIQNKWSPGWVHRVTECKSSVNYLTQLSNQLTNKRNGKREWGRVHTKWITNKKI